MKKCFIGLTFFSLLIAFRCKNENHFVFDFEHDFTAAQIDSFEHLFSVHEQATTNQIALVTTGNYGKDANIKSFGKRFGNENGVGNKKNNGIVIVFSNAKHQANISTGYGVEKIITDSIAKHVIDSIMIPEFRQDHSFEGILKGSKAVISVLEKPGNKIN